MTNHKIPAPGDFRVCAFAAPGHVVATTVDSVREARNVREFATATNLISRQHTGNEYPSDAFVQRFNGTDWYEVPVNTGDLPWRVISVQGVFRFVSEEAATAFALPGEDVEFSPNLKLARMG